MKFKVIDECPAPAGLAPELIVIKKQLAVPTLYESIYRGTDARALLARYGKHDQEYLYEHQGTQGIGPANPPGHSTHELFSDGVAYAIPDGHRIPQWCCGIDVRDEYVERFIAVARERGWIVTITYPTASGSEHHHVNFRKRPVLFLPLHRGDKGPRVEKLTRRLSYVLSPRTHEPYFDHKQNIFGPAVKEAVGAFQADHHLHRDGVVGPHTAHQLAVSTRHRTKVLSR
jgi:peptidoglycan hydrolase-like protein with peptidoglycan-binding domain